VIEGGLTFRGRKEQPATLCWGQGFGTVKACPRLQSGLDGLGQPNLILRGQQIDFAEFTEVEIQQVFWNRTMMSA
jgi:hypothetical protein